MGAGLRSAGKPSSPATMDISNIFFMNRPPSRRVYRLSDDRSIGPQGATNFGTRNGRGGRPWNIIRRLLQTCMYRNKVRELVSRCRTGGIAAGLLRATGVLANAVPCAAQKSSPAKAGVATRSKSRADIARFRERVEAALTEVHAQKTYWGVVVADKDTGAILYEPHADHFFTPASNAKIFTTALALASLPPSFRFRTTLESQGMLGTDGRLAGDLRFVGRGDPDLSNRKFPYAGKVEHEGPTEKVLAEMIDEAIAKGLKEVDGDIVADDSYFPYDPYPAGWSVGDLFFTFGAPVSAIAFNDNSISLDVSPGVAAGNPGVVTISP